jgi:glycerol-3-phosphate acyltransferase PlsY
VAASYLAGAFPTAELVTRARGRDVHHEGSGNPGATNTFRIAGARAAALVVVVDVAKGAATTLAGRSTGGDALGAACGVAAVLGHCFPPRNPGDGGKGVATTGGMLLALDPPLAVVTAAAWAATAKASHRASLASVSVAAALPVAAAILGRRRSEQLALLAVSAIIVVRHGDNIARLWTGREPPVAGYETGYGNARNPGDG